MKYLVNKLRNWLTRRLFFTVNPDNVIKQDDILDPTTKKVVVRNGKLLLGGKEISDWDLAQLKEEILHFEQTQLWKIYQETIRNMVWEMEFKNSQSFEDTKSAKLMIVNLDIQQSINDVIKQYKKK